jgi:predicted amidohydrolase
VVFLAAAAAQFGRDLDFDLDRVASIVEAAKRAGAGLLVLPDGTLGGYLEDLRGQPGPDELPPALDADDPVFERLAELAGDLVLCLGYRERVGALTYNAAVCLSGAGVHGRHRKVHLAPGERESYASGERFAAFDTPIGRLGMLIDYDKTFPEAARALAADGAILLACLSAWPTSLTDPARRLVKDRQARLFDLYDCARAAENQVVLVSANQTGRSGALTFLGNAKVVGPGGDIRARTWSKAGLAVAEVDLAAEVARSRRVLHHLAELRPAAYHPEPVVDPAGEPAVTQADEPASAEPAGAEPAGAEPAGAEPEVAEPVVVEP